MLFAATFFLVLPRMLARLYTRDPLVTGIAVRLLPIAGFFQVFDGLQVVAAGVLRGLGDTRVPMLISLLGFWLLGVPVSLLLAFGTGGGPGGLWWGFVTGLGSVAVLSLVRVRARLRRSLARVVIDAPEGAVRPESS